MSTVQEIKAAIARLDPMEREHLMAEIMASTPEVNAGQLEASLDRGLADMAAGRVRPIAEVPALIRLWMGRS